MNKTTKYLLTSICIGALQLSNAAMAQSMMSKDSTSLMPSGMLSIIPKANRAVAPTYNAPGRINNSGAAYCGASANSILPDVPNSFLCSSGNASKVTTVNRKYLWTCTGVTGLVSSCSADDRIIGTCGSDNGKNLSTQPSNLCSDGSASSVNLSGSAYNWTCDGNYGPRASCSATYNPPVPACKSEGIIIVGTIGWTCDALGEKVYTTTFGDNYMVDLGKGDMATIMIRYNSAYLAWLYSKY